MTGRTAPWGIDVSSYQPHVRWAEVAQAGCAFAFVKATEGLRWNDPTFAYNWRYITEAGIKVKGAYHYGHVENDAVAEADHFVRVVAEQGIPPEGVFLVLDAEDVCRPSTLVGPAATVDWVLTFCGEVHRRTGVPKNRILVYTGQWWWGPRTAGSGRVAAAGYPLWLSAYTPKPGKVQGWPKHLFWQYTDRRSTPGAGNVDGNWFNGTSAELLTAAGYGAGPVRPRKPAGYPGVPLGAGSTGAPVETVQAALGVRVDGVWGPQTARALARWKRRRLIGGGGRVLRRAGFERLVRYGRRKGRLA